MNRVAIGVVGLNTNALNFYKKSDLSKKGFKSKDTAITTSTVTLS